MSLTTTVHRRRDRGKAGVIALSAAVRRLKSELDVEIVRRGRRFEGFTDEGAQVVGWAHRIVAERDALLTDLDRQQWKRPVATGAQLNDPNWVTVSSDGGFLIADFGNHAVREVAAD